MTTERKTELAKQLVAIIFELTSAGEVPTDVMPVEQPKKPVEMLTLCIRFASLSFRAR